MTEIALVEVPAMNVLGRKKKGTYALIPELLMNVFTVVQKKKAAIADRRSFCAMRPLLRQFWKQMKKGTAEIEVAGPVNEPVKGTKEIKAYVLPGGTDGTCRP